MTPLVSVVIPIRPHEDISITMNSLMRQTLQEFEVHVVVDYGLRGAPWARNTGAARAVGPYLLFCDSDIDWVPDALETMVKALDRPDAMLPDDEGYTTDYAYGAYQVSRGGHHREPAVCAEEWERKKLNGKNYVSTMSLMRRTSFPGFDETLRRLQDWDLWLTMAEKKIKGVYVGKVLFTTPYRHNGITHGSGITYDEAFAIVRKKHGLA